jgi:hypothetical protein
MKLYRGKISYLLPFLFLPALFTIAIILDGHLKMPSRGIFILIWIPFLSYTITSLGYKLELGDNFVRESFLGFTTMKLYSANVESIKYGGVGLWGGLYGKITIHGNGLAILVYANGERKVYGISEKLYGKKAIEDLKKTLGSTT